jgi:putative hydrolase of the HAD superfamily
MFNGVIFDLDDTLYDYESIHPIAIENVCNYICRKLNINSQKFYDVLEKARYETKLYTKNTAACHNRLIYFQKTIELLGANPFSYSMEMYDLYWEYMLNNIRLKKGAKEVLDELKNRNIKIAICTDLTAHIQYRKIKKLKIDQYIDCIVTSEEAGEEKPGKNMFSITLKKMNIDKSEVFFVGDSLEKDIVGAHNAGIFPVWFNPNKKKAENVGFEYMQIECLTEIKKLNLSKNKSNF